MNQEPLSTPATTAVQLVKSKATLKAIVGMDYAVWQGDAETLLNAIPEQPLFDLVVSSPPYNIGKSYEKKEHWKITLNGKSGFLT
ncbi:hypothetical protein [Thauera sp. SDU_THAU2]|uniref:hypothetical protein n=1 Tax=Thauera sp. SDU_THAU2 TaxID=3136633 RepID=UPI00311DBEC1